MNFFPATILTLASVLILGGGCLFSRSVVNGHVREMRTGWIVPGVTTKEEVIRRLGYPPFGKESRAEISGNTFRYVCTDTRTGKFEGGYIFTPTFERTRAQAVHDILIVFTGQGIVQRISRVETDEGGVHVLQYKEEKP